MVDTVLPLVTLQKTGLVTSRLAFGTSRLHYLRPRDRQILLAAAADFGFLHFDSAPSYGDGLAEMELGQFLARGGERFIVATKYGIPADPFLQRWRFAAPLLRSARAVARRVGFWRNRLPTLTGAGLRDSVESSLRRLKRDRVDILLLHEPSVTRLSNPEEILAQLNDLKQRGLIRAFGVAGGWGGIESLLDAEPRFGQVIQTAESEWLDTFPPDITYGAISGAYQSYLRAGLSSELAQERLRAALARRPHGVVIVSSTKMRNLQALAQVTRDLRT